MQVQSDVFTIVLVTILLGSLSVWLGKKIEKVDPFAKPSGIIVPVIWFVEMIHKNVVENVGEKIAQELTPYILTIAVYIFTSNIISLFGLPSPTANLSVTLLLAIITWVLIQITEFKYQGVKAYFHSFLEPFAVMLPMNIIGKFSILISMSMRLFGNILCGSMLMSLIYSFAQYLSNLLVGWLVPSGQVFNFMALIIAPVLHAYFDVFAGFIQTLVFVTLTMVLIGNDIPDEVKKV